MHIHFNWHIIQQTICQATLQFKCVTRKPPLQLLAQDIFSTDVHLQSQWESLHFKTLAFGKTPRSLGLPKKVAFLVPGIPRKISGKFLKMEEKYDLFTRANITPNNPYICWIGLIYPMGNLTTLLSETEKKLFSPPLTQLNYWNPLVKL